MSGQYHRCEGEQRVGTVSRHSRIRICAMSGVTRLGQSSNSSLRVFQSEDGLTVVELILALAISSIIVFITFSAFIGALRVNEHNSDTLVNQQTMMVIIERLRADIMRADPVILDPVDPDGPSDHFDFGVSEVTTAGGALIHTRSYYRYTVSSGEIVKRPIEYDDASGQMVDTGEEPVWSYGNNVSDLKFTYDISPSDGSVRTVTVSITVGSGSGAYSQTIKVAPRNAI